MWIALIARVGQHVEFRNSEDMPHNVAVTRRTSGAEVFNVGTEPHQKYVHTFDRVAADRLRVAGAHLDYPGFGHIVRQGASYRFEPDQ